MENKYICKICGNKVNNPFIAKELMLGLNTEFEYFECNSCKCIQINTIPDNISDYYPKNYLSFTPTSSIAKTKGIKRKLKSTLTNYYLGKDKKPLGGLLSIFFRNPFPFLKDTAISTESKIIDIGCGTGKLLLKMRNNGFNNLHGIDLFIEQDYLQDNINIIKQDLFHLTDTYDLIMLNHSFEHMEEPEKVLNRLKMHLTEKGIIIIRIPVAGSYAWRKYGINWVQLDAPRHYYLHTIKSISLLCKNAGLNLVNILFESSAFQFTESEKYLRGLSFNSTNNIFTKKQLREFKAKAKELNEINDGDSACFYISKN